MGARDRPMMRVTALRTGAIAFCASVAFAILAPATVLAAEPAFGPPSVRAVVGEPVIFTSTIDGATDVASVDVVIHVLGNPTSIIVNAGTQINNVYQAEADIDIASSAGCNCLANGETAPNTHFDYQFRVTATDGATDLGPVAQAVFEDTRFEWQTLAQDQVVVHWYAGDQAFGQSASDVANGAIDEASQLLGATLDKPVDLFVYNTEEDMRSAISPNRENVAGEAHPDIDTMYVLIPSNEGAETFAGTLIRHELTHLVFHRAVDNAYHGVPRWLDEGTAVYVSEGYTDYWKNFVNGGVASHSLIPLDGLAGLFPSVRDEFYLAYGESVAAVDYFIRTYGDETFWNLVRSYANGVSDDEAFTAATGADVDAFNTGWFASLSLTPPEPAGPQPGAPGPLPADWSGEPGAPPTLSPTTAPGATPAAVTSRAPETARPVGSSNGSGAPSNPENTSTTDPTTILLVLGIVVALVVGTLAVGIALRGRPSGPRPGF
jgi:hypothetical protein